METYLPIIKAYLADWLQLTLNNPLYAAALAAVVFLLTAILYSIRIASLSKANRASEKAHSDTQNSLKAALDTAQQQTQQMQEQLAANTVQMEQAKLVAQQESQRADGLEEQLSQRNQQIAGINQNLATRFDLGERPLPVMGDIKAEDLWQQHDRVVNLLSTRLQSEQQTKTELQHAYQAETVKRAEKEALLETMQTTLTTQTIQLSKLEEALEEQKSLLQEQQDKAQQVLSQTLEKHLAELARITELEQQALELVNTRQQLTQLEEKLTAKEALITQLEMDKPVEPVKMQPQPAPLKQEKIETIIELPKTEEAVPPVPLDIEEQVVSSVKEQSGGVAGKLKGMFGKTKQEPIPEEPEAVETRQYKEEPQPAPVAVEQTSVSSVKDKYGRIKHYFGDMKQQSEDTKQDKAETQPAAFEDKQPPASAAKGQLGKLKNLFGSKQQPEDTRYKEEAQPTSSDVEQPPVNTIKIPVGKLKKLFGSKQKTNESKQAEEAIQPAPPEVAQPSASPAKGQLGKLKNLFGKTK